MSDDVELRTVWREEVGTSAACEAALQAVLGRHREPHRRYHGVRHVTWVVRHINELCTEVSIADRAAVTAAAFYHDAVYDPRASDNEVQSAALAERVLEGLGWPTPRCATVGELVRATAGHEPTDDPDRAVLIDADLAVLGAEPSAYQAYVVGVRAEYSHVELAAWRAGRAAVLEGFLARPVLYSTPAGQARWGARARANMAAELASLR